MNINLLKPTGYVMHQQFNIKHLYALSTLHLFVMYLSQRGWRIGSWWGNRRVCDNYRDLGVDG